MNSSGFSRRGFLRRSAFAASAAFAGSAFAESPFNRFRFRYIVGSSMYGTLPLGEIVPEVPKTGAEYLDIWPKVHGNQREQMEEMGHDKFAALLARHGVKPGCLTRYDLGPFGLQEEMRVGARLGCNLIVCGGKGPRDAKGAALKKAVGEFCEKMKPHLELAEGLGVTVAIENHGNNLIDSPDSLRWLIELAPSKNLGVALAPYHLENLGETSGGLASLIRDLGNRMSMFYAWQYGMGCHKKLPKEQELLQMPGRGDLDFAPIVKALKDVNYRGFTQIFMHPVPRGIPILPTASEVTEEINRSRKYLEKLVT